MSILIRSDGLTARLLELPKLKADLQRLKTNDVPKAIRTALKHTGKAARPVVSKLVKEHYTYTAVRIKRDVTTRYLSSDSIQVKLSSKPPTVLAASFKGPASSLKTRKAVPMSWSILKGSRTRSKRGFMLPGRQGLLLPFIRTTKKGTRYPIDVIHAPSLYNLFTSGQFASDMTSEATSILNERLVTETARAIRQYGRIR